MTHQMSNSNSSSNWKISIFYLIELFDVFVSFGQRPQRYSLRCPLPVDLRATSGHVMTLNWFGLIFCIDFSMNSPDVGGQGQRKSGQLCLVLVRPDRQTTDRVFFENPDKIRTPDRIETDRIRTDRHRTGFFTKFRTESGQRTESRQTESGQTDTGQRILTESRPVLVRGSLIRTKVQRRTWT